MLLWISIALLTAAAIMAVLMPLGRRRVAEEGTAPARDIYLHQLDELKRDRAEGRIDANEAESARAEIARRLIAADAQDLAPAAENPRVRRATAVAALVGIPALSLTLYLGLGAPALPGQPLAARLADPAADDIETLVRKVEEHLAKSPEDGRGWDVIAPVYLRIGRAQEAAIAYRNAIRLVGSTVGRETGLGQAILAVEGGIVTAEARAAFEAASQAAPAAPGPRFFLALAAEQEGKADEAAEDYRALLAEAPADVSWRPAVEDALRRVTAGTDSPGPTAEQVAAAQGMSASDRGSMIEGMVEGLATRLKQEPDDVEGWLRLIRSYAVLGRSEDAAKAAQEALTGVRGDSDRRRVEALIADLGLAPTGAATP